MTHDVIRVVSANLWNGGAKPEAIGSLLERMAIDIGLFQEVTPLQAEAVAAVLPHGKFLAGTDRHGMGIAARREITVERVPLIYRDAWAADMKLTDGTAVRVINMHLKAPHDTAPWRSVTLRRTQLNGLIHYVKGSLDQPLVLGGDLNSTPIWPAYRRLKAILTDAALEVGNRKGRRPARTWGPWHGAPRLLRIDHVFVNRLTVEDFHVIDIDHSAVVAELRLA